MIVQSLLMFVVMDCCDSWRQESIKKIIENYYFVVINRLNYNDYPSFYLPPINLLFLSLRFFSLVDIYLFTPLDLFLS